MRFSTPANWWQALLNGNAGGLSLLHQHNVTITHAILYMDYGCCNTLNQVR